MEHCKTIFHIVHKNRGKFLRDNQTRLKLISRGIKENGRQNFHALSPIRFGQPLLKQGTKSLLSHHLNILHVLPWRSLERKCGQVKGRIDF
jgi:hypothetical protein